VPGVGDDVDVGVQRGVQLVEFRELLALTVVAKDGHLICPQNQDPAVLTPRAASTTLDIQGHRGSQLI
jgi:hypothetical protein